jgi:hypothetical protein
MCRTVQREGDRELCNMALYRDTDSFHPIAPPAPVILATIKRTNITHTLHTHVITCRKREWIVLRAFFLKYTTQTSLSFLSID